MSLTDLKYAKQRIAELEAELEKAEAERDKFRRLLQNISMYQTGQGRAQ